MSFDDAAVRNLFSQVVSHAASLGLFERVCSHEPKNAPGNGLSCSIWVQSIKLAGRASGLNMVSGVVTLSIRVMSNMLREPQDDTDRLILTAVSVLMKEYSGTSPSAVPRGRWTCSARSATAWRLTPAT